MKLERKIFDKVITFSKQSDMSTAEIAKYFNISERMVQRVREAGTWDRWPYIVAKATHGYNTPEYKLYLKRRGLPLTPPAKYQVHHREVAGQRLATQLTAELKKRSLLDRLFRRR